MPCAVSRATARAGANREAVIDGDSKLSHVYSGGVSAAKMLLAGRGPPLTSPERARAPFKSWAR